MADESAGTPASWWSAGVPVERWLVPVSLGGGDSDHEADRAGQCPRSPQLPPLGCPRRSRSEPPLRWPMERRWQRLRRQLHECGVELVTGTGGVDRVEPALELVHRQMAEGQVLAESGDHVLAFGVADANLSVEGHRASFPVRGGWCQVGPVERADAGWPRAAVRLRRRQPMDPRSCEQVPGSVLTVGWGRACPRGEPCCGPQMCGQDGEGRGEKHHLQQGPRSSGIAGAPASVSPSSAA